MIIIQPLCQFSADFNLGCSDILSSIDFQKSTQLNENFVERATEFESATTAWKAVVLPTTPYPHMFDTNLNPPCNELKFVVWMT